MILYYSNYCGNCRQLLPVLSQSQVKNDIHFICIDNRVKKSDGSTYIILPNQKEIILPNFIKAVNVDKIKEFSNAELDALDKLLDGKATKKDYNILKGRK